MTGTTGPPGTAGLTDRNVVFIAAAAGALVAIGLSVGFDTVTGPSRVGILLVLGVAMIAVMAALAVVWFDAFVFGVLAARSSLDYLKVRSGSEFEPTVAVAVFFLFAALVWLAAGTRGRRWHGATFPLTRTATVFLAALLLSTAVSVDPVASAAEWARVAAVVVMIAVLERIFLDRSALRAGLVAVATSLVLPAAVALYQWRTGSDVTFVGEFRRVSGTFSHPNSFGIYLALCTVMAAGLLFHVSQRWKVAIVSWVAIAATCLLLTYTRGAWIAGAIGVLVVVGLHRRRLVVWLLGAMVLAYALIPGVHGRFSDLGEDERPSGATGNSLVWRLQHWNEAIELTRGREMTGLGPRMTERLSEDAKLPHNDYLRAYVEGGVVGFVTYVALLGSFVVVAVRAWRRADAGLERGVAAGFAGCTVTFLVVSVTENLMSQVVVFWYFAVFAAAASAIARDRSADSAESGAMEVDVARQ